MFRKLAAEFIGTFWLVFAGCGAALFSAAFPDVGVGFIGVGLAFGLAVLTMAYAVGPISGAHFNPAVSLGLAVAGRFEWAHLIGYWIAQLVGGLVAAVLLYLMATGKAGFAIGTGPGAFATNGYDALSPGGYSMLAAFIAEVVLTGAFVMVILGSTSRAAAPGFAPLAIGLCLTIIHFVAIPIDNTSVNPTRSIVMAVFAGAGPLSQLWLFIVAPLIGGAAGAALWRYVLAPGEADENIGQVK